MKTLILLAVGEDFQQVKMASSYVQGLAKPIMIRTMGATSFISVCPLGMEISEAKEILETAQEEIKKFCKAKFVTIATTILLVNNKEITQIEF